MIALRRLKRSGSLPHHPPPDSGEREPPPRPLGGWVGVSWVGWVGMGWRGWEVLGTECEHGYSRTAVGAPVFLSRRNIDIQRLPVDRSRRESGAGLAWLASRGGPCLAAPSPAPSSRAGPRECARRERESEHGSLRRCQAGRRRSPLGALCTLTLCQQRCSALGRRLSCDRYLADSCVASSRLLSLLLLPLCPAAPLPRCPSPELEHRD